MYKLKDIRAIHIEPTERCNLSCLMCDRNKNGGEVNQYLRNRELTLEAITKTFNTDLIQQLKRIYFCGNYGEPILAKDLLDILKFFREKNSNLKLSIITNGCYRPTTWWKEIAGIINSARFGIDGLEDTHKIYRQKANWNLIIENAKAFIDVGGYAIWDYLVFGHNEHQIEKARSLSKELGFKEFVVKKTGRFFSNIKLKGKEEHVGLTKPRKEQNINKSLKKEGEIIKKYGSMEKYLDQVPIHCKVLENKEFFISAEGLVLPCCWLAGSLYKWYLPPKASQIWKLIDKEKVDIHKMPLEQIFNFGIFEQIKGTWSKPSCKEGKLKVCALKCGKELDQFGDQFK